MFQDNPHLAHKVQFFLFILSLPLPKCQQLSQADRSRDTLCNFEYSLIDWLLCVYSLDFPDIQALPAHCPYLYAKDQPIPEYCMFFRFADNLIIESAQYLLSLEMTQPTWYAIVAKINAERI